MFDWVLNTPLNKAICLRLIEINYSNVQSVCSNENYLTPIFFRMSKVCSILHYRSLWQVQVKEFNLIFKHIFWHFFVVSHSKIRVFIIFNSFFGEVSNFRYRILTNQKPELLLKMSVKLYAMQISLKDQLYLIGRRSRCIL